MSPELAVFILMNNYFHDVATAMLLACAIALSAILHRPKDAADPGVVAHVCRLIAGITALARFSIVWIIIGAIPRIITFRTFEWANAVEKHHEAGLLAKYIIAFVMMIAGAYLWFKLQRQVREMLLPRQSES